METFDITIVSYVSLNALFGQEFGFLEYFFLRNCEFNPQPIEIHFGSVLSSGYFLHHFSFILDFKASRSSGVMEAQVL